MRAVEIKCSEYVSNTGTHESSEVKVDLRYYCVVVGL